MNYLSIEIQNMENKDKLYTGIIITVLAMAFMFVILVTTLVYTSSQKNDLSFEIVSQEDSFGNEPVTLKKGEDGYIISFLYYRNSGVSRKTITVPESEEIVYRHSENKGKISYTVKREGTPDEKYMMLRFKRI